MTKLFHLSICIIRLLWLRMARMHAISLVHQSQTWPELARRTLSEVGCRMHGSCGEDNVMRIVDQIGGVLLPSQVVLRREYGRRYLSRTLPFWSLMCNEFLARTFAPRDCFDLASLFLFFPPL